jgi:tetratricopeptide (TPR) repeat protein
MDDWEGVQRSNRETIALSTEWGLSGILEPVARRERLVAVALHCDPEQMEYKRRHPQPGFARSLHDAVLARAYGRRGEPEEGLRILEATPAWADETGSRFFDAEVYRTRAELLLLVNRPDEAEQSYDKALETARAQNARMWELHAACGLARLWRDQGHPAEAHDLLAPIYSWFSEGFGTPDLQTAQVLLAMPSMSPSAFCNQRDSGPGGQALPCEAGAEHNLIGKRAPSVKRVVLETGPLSVWVYHALCAEGLPAICIDARHAKAALDMAANKTDAHDADGLAPPAEVGFVREVRAKGIYSMLVRTLVAACTRQVRITTELSNQISGLMKTCGLPVPAGKGSTFEKNVRSPLVNLDELAASCCRCRRHGAAGIVNLTDFACFVPVSGQRGFRTFNGLEASAMHSSCSNLLKLAVPHRPRAVTNLTVPSDSDSTSVAILQAWLAPSPHYFWRGRED